MERVVSALTDFLLARFAEDEAAARAATPGPWIVRSLGYVAGGGATSLFGTDVHDAPADHEPDAEHIARHDPARVLAECEAKRRIVEEATGQHTSSEEGYSILRIMATVHADHPDYREEWRA